MNICYVTSVRLPTERPHGYGIARMCEAFAAIGHELTLVSPTKSSTWGSDIFVAYGLSRIFTHARVKTPDLVYWERLGTGPSYWFDFLWFSFAARVSRFRQIAQADIIYLREPYLAFFFPRRKVILELHTMPAQTVFMRRLLSSVRKLNAISHGLAKDITTFTGRDDVTVIPDAVDLKRFAHMPDTDAARRALELPAGKPIVVYTGNFYPWKGVDTLADAAVLLPDMEVVLVGGTDEYDYQRIAAKTASASNLIVRRFEPLARMPLYLAAADVLVIPNAKGTAISERHTSPLKLFEYMASGKPIVASDLPSLREILDDSTAIFFEPGNPRSLAAAIQQALDPVIAERLGSEVLRRVRVYSWEARASAALKNI